VTPLQFSTAVYNNPEWEVFEEYCRRNGLKFDKFRRRKYSSAEIEAAPFFFVEGEPAPSDTRGTQYSSESACPRCGVGLTQVGPLVLKARGVNLRKKKMFCVNLRQSTEWVINVEFCPLFRDLTGFRFGEVVSSLEPVKPIETVKQIVIESRLPRMARSTNFFEYDDPPMKDRCPCNRAGWSLRDEIIYERAALKDARDFNWTVERWYGGGPVGFKRPIVSQRVRRVIMKNKLLRQGNFDPVHVIEKDIGGEYKFQLPL
jgi:hypothetical protein